MATSTAFNTGIGFPPAAVQAWINHLPYVPPSPSELKQFNIHYKLEGDAEWQEYEPTSNDIKIADDVVTFTATDFKKLENFEQVREVTLPNKWNNGSEDVDITSIGEQTFAGRSGLTSVIINNSMRRIEDYVFAGCSGLISVIIPDSVTSIGMRVFEACTSLASVTIPNSAPSIGGWAFDGCSGLTSVEFKGNAPIVGSGAFHNVASGCKAIISSTATGFNVDSQGKWNGLIVERRTA